MMKTGSLLFLLLAAVFFLLPVSPQAAPLRAPHSAEKEVTAPGTAVAQPDSAKNDIRDIYGPVTLPEPPPYVLIGALTLLTLAAVAGLLFLLKRRNKSTVPPPDPAVRALSELLAAENERPKTGIPLFADKVSHILRSYIEDLFTIKTTRRTTAEFFAELNSLLPGSDDALAKHADSLRQCLMLCDMIKFAGFQPKDNDAVELGTSVRRFIEETRRTPATEV